MISNLIDSATKTTSMVVTIIYINIVVGCGYNHVNRYRQQRDGGDDVANAHVRAGGICSFDEYCYGLRYSAYMGSIGAVDYRIGFSM